MISTDFAPNETVSDAILSMKLIFQPWKWIKGPESNWIKQRIQQDFPKSEIFLFLSGRSALFNLLASLNLPKNSEIIVQGFTCEAVILPIIANKLKPIYVDIEDTSFSLDPIDLEKKITKNTKVVILQHTFGLDPLNRKKIIDLISQHKLLLIEDIAHGYNLEKLRITNYQLPNSVVLLSFGRSKALSSVFGSAIVTNNSRIIEQIAKQQVTLDYPKKLFILKLLIYKPLTVLIKKTYDLGLGKLLHKIFNRLNLLIPEITSCEKSGKYDDLFDHKYPNALACLLKLQYAKMIGTNKIRAQACSFYSKNLIIPNYQLPITNYSLIRFPILINNRDYILSKLYKQNIFLGKWYDQVVGPRSLDLSRVEYQLGSCPVAEDICKKIINLPTNINRKQAEKIVNILNDVI